jgi:hypothetical protein
MATSFIFFFRKTKWKRKVTPKSFRKGCRGDLKEKRSKIREKESLFNFMITRNPNWSFRGSK